MWTCGAIAHPRLSFLPKSRDYVLYKPTSRCGHMGFLQVLAGSGALAVFALGVAMIRLNEFTAAYYLFLASGAFATVGGLWYGFTSLDSLLLRYGSGFMAGIFVFVLLPIALRWLEQIRREGWECVPRYIVGAAIGAVAFIGVPEVARWANRGPFAQAQPAPPPSPPVAQPAPPPGSGNCNNNGINTGTINNNCPTYNSPPRRPDGLYQADQLVGQVVAAQPGPAPNQVTFQNLRIASGTVDLSAPFEFQNVIVSCGMSKPSGMAAFTSIMVPGATTCEIVGRRQ